MSKRGRTPSRSDDVWPARVRTTARVALVLVVGIGVVVALHDRGLLALTGPLVVLVAAPAVGLAGIEVARRRWSSQQRRTGELLSRLVDLLEAELAHDQERLVRTTRSWPPGTPLSTASAHLDRESARLRRTESWLERLRASRARRSGSAPDRQSS